MQLSVKGRNLEVTDALRTYAEEKVQRMGRYLEGSAPPCRALGGKHRQIAEVTLRVRDLTVRAEESTDDMYSSLSISLRKNWSGRFSGTKSGSSLTWIGLFIAKIGKASRARGRGGPVVKTKRLPSSRRKWRKPSADGPLGHSSTCFGMRALTK
jgi:putative sigma-54 modulation protein